MIILSKDLPLFFSFACSDHRLSNPPRSGIIFSLFPTQKVRFTNRAHIGSSDGPPSLHRTTPAAIRFSGKMNSQHYCLRHP